MIDLSFYVNNIIAGVPEVQQVIQPERVSLTAVDTSALITGLMRDSVDDRVYAYKLPDDAIYPSITYEQVGQQKEEVDGYVVTKTDVFVVAIQAESLADLISVIDSVRNSLLTYAATDAAGGIEITDQAIKYDSELKRYEAAIELEVAHLTLPSQATPAYYLYPFTENSQANESMNCVSQLTDERFVGLLVAQVPASGVSGLADLRKAIFGEIINKIPAAKAGRTEHIQGGIAGLVGSIVIYRDVFNVNTHSHFI